MKRKHFWIDPPLQIQMIGTTIILVAASLVLVSFSLLKGFEVASRQSHQIFHSLDWVRETARRPLFLSSLISLLATAIVTLVWSHRYAGPLRVLSAAMHRIRQNNLAVPVRIRQTDSHQELVREFSEMQDHLRDRLGGDHKKIGLALEKIEEAAQRLPQNDPAKADLSSASDLLKEIPNQYRL